MLQLPVGLEHGVRVDRQARHHVLDRRQLVALAQQAEPQRLPHLLDHLQVRRDAGAGVQVELDHRALYSSRYLLLTVLITAAGLQDRDAAKPLLWNLKKAFPAVRLAWADGGYASKLVTWAKTALKLTLQIVRRPDDLHTFQVLPRRWVVERTLAWITRCRRTVRDYERLPAHHESIVYWAMIITMTRRLAALPAPPRVSTAAGPAMRWLASRLPGMTNAHEVVAAYWAAAEARDWKAFGALLAEQVVYEAPQFRERVRGRTAYVRFNVEGFP